MASWWRRGGYRGGEPPEPRLPCFPSRDWRKATEAELTCPWCHKRMTQLRPGDADYDPLLPVQTRHEPVDRLACPGPRPQGVTS